MLESETQGILKIVACVVGIQVTDVFAIGAVSPIL